MNSRSTVFVALIAMLMLGCGSSVLEPVAIGEPVPPIELSNVDGSNFHLSDLRGNLVVVNFWSTSCLSCLKEIDVLQGIQSDGSARVVGIALDDDTNRVRQVIERKGISYPVVLGDDDLFVRFDGVGIPYTVILDAELNVKKKINGPVSKDEFTELLSLFSESPK